MENAYLSAGLASVHYLALALGFWGLSERTIAAKKLSRSGPDAEIYWPTLFRGDNLWGIAALLFIGSGLVRAFGGFEKAPEFYLKNGFFHIKMTLFLLIFLCEVAPMMKLIRARVSRRKERYKAPLNISQLKGIFRAGMVEIHLLTLVVICATLMARGVWIFAQ